MDWDDGLLACEEAFEDEDTMELEMEEEEAHDWDDDGWALELTPEEQHVRGGGLA
jgi:hypothetical protein